MKTINIYSSHPTDSSIYWGDYSYSICIATYFNSIGYDCSVIPYNKWEISLEADINICIAGLNIFRPKLRNLYLLWVISHPDKLNNNILNLYDHIFIASNDFQINHKSTSILLQGCNNLYVDTRKRVFKYDNFLFLGCKRPGRISLQYCKDLFPLKEINNLHYKLISTTYQNYKAVLNDHHSSMKNNGFINNRFYDVLACESPLLTEYVVGMEHFDMFQFSSFTCKNTFIDAASNVHLPNKEYSKYIKENHSLFKRAEVITTYF